MTRHDTTRAENARKHTSRPRHAKMDGGTSAKPLDERSSSRMDIDSGKLPGGAIDGGARNCSTLADDEREFLLRERR